MMKRSPLIRIDDMLQNIAAIGNILRHDYQGVAHEIIWNVAKKELPPLKTALLAMQASLND